MSEPLQANDIVALADTREQAPLDLYLPTEIATLKAADYSVKRLEHVIAVERKSLVDLVACCGRERDRFEACIQRMKGYPVRALVIEASLIDIKAGGWRGRITPGMVLNSLCSWAKHVTVFPAHDRTTAGLVVSGILLSAARERYREDRAFMKAILRDKQEESA